MAAVQKLQANGGYFCGPTENGGGGTAGSVGATLPSLYFGQCLCEPDASTCSSDPDAGACTPCAAFDDLQVASTGLDPNGTWITRMRAILPSSALASDLVVEAASPQASVSNQYTASSYDDPTFDPCTASTAAGGNGAGSGGGGCNAVDRSPLLSERTLILSSLGIAWAVGVRRRRQRRQRPQRPA